MQACLALPSLAKFLPTQLSRNGLTEMAPIVL